METQLKRLVMLVFVMSGLWWVVVCLILGAFFFVVKAAVTTLTPLVGDSFAYAAGGVLCAMPAIVALLLLRSATTKKGAAEKQDENGPLDIRNLSLLIRDYPLEAAMLAFALGFSRESVVDLKHVISAASSHNRRE